MTNFNIPENVKTQALMINALHYMAKNSEHNADLMGQAMEKMVNGEYPPKEVVYEFFSKFAHSWMTITLLCDEVVDTFMVDAKEFSKGNEEHREDIQTQLKAHPFMQKMMLIVTESNETRAHRLLAEAIGDGMPDDLAEEIRAMMKND